MVKPPRSLATGSPPAVEHREGPFDLKLTFVALTRRPLQRIETQRHRSNVPDSSKQTGGGLRRWRAQQSARVPPSGPGRGLVRSPHRPCDARRDRRHRLGLRSRRPPTPHGVGADLPHGHVPPPPSERGLRDRQPGGGVRSAAGDLLEAGVRRRATATLGFGGWIWRYDLAPLGPSETEVILTYDWSAVFEEVLRRQDRWPPFPPDHLDNSLTHLAELALPSVSSLIGSAAPATSRRTNPASFADQTGRRRLKLLYVVKGLFPRSG